METRTILLIVGGGLLAFAAYKFAQQNGLLVTPAYASLPPQSDGANALDVTPTDYASTTGTQTVLPPLSSYATSQRTAPMPQAGNADADILTRTILGEARNQGEAGMEAVANVVMNRYHDGHFPGAGSVAGICKAPYQFSCWNRSSGADYYYTISVQSSDPLYQEAMGIALRALNGSLVDNTDGATYYHTTAIATPSEWGNVTQTASIGSQVFFSPSEGSG